MRILCTILAVLALVLMVLAFLAFPFPLPAAEPTVIEGILVMIRHPDIIVYDVNGVPIDTTADVRLYRNCPSPGTGGITENTLLPATQFLKAHGVDADSFIVGYWYIDLWSIVLDSDWYEYYYPTVEHTLMGGGLDDWVGAAYFNSMGVY